MIKKTEKPLKPSYEDFCINYVKNSAEFGDASKAYQESFNCEKLKSSTVRRNAYRLLQNPKIQARIQELREEIIEKSKMSIDDVLNRWIEIATADPNDLIQLRRECCRHCYGVDNKYQWIDEDEFNQAYVHAKNRKHPLPINEGGYGFTSTLDPNLNCKHCCGYGLERIFISDTRKLAGKSKLLYAGIKQTKNGIEVLMRNQDQALENIAKFLGMFKDNGQSGSGSGPNILGKNQRISEVTKDPLEASKIYNEIMGA